MSYETFVDGEESEQVKAFQCEMDAVKKDDTVRCKEFGIPETCTIACPAYRPEDAILDFPFNVSGMVIGFDGEEPKAEREWAYKPRIFVLIRDSKFVGFTKDPKEIIYPLYDKYGSLIASEPAGA